MQIHVGFEMIYDCPQPTPMIFNLNVHFTRVSDLVGRDNLVVDPPVPMAAYRTASETGAPALSPRKAARASRRMRRQRHRSPGHHSPSGTTDSGAGPAGGHPRLPARKPVLRNRSAVRDGMEALRRANRMGPSSGDLRLRSRHVQFGYEHARMTRTALEKLRQPDRVCRDFTHLAIAFCAA